MGIKADFSIEDVRKRYNAFLDEVERKQISRLMKLGEMCVTHARSIPKGVGYEDQTGNLRSSTGYTVFVDGVAINSFYRQVAQGAEGVREGQILAERIGKDTKGVSVVVTAGMNYAMYLEARGRDVLTSAEQLAEKELPKMLEQLVSNIKRAAE